MEKSSNSHMPRPSCSKERTPSPSEESGWSMYIADFIATQAKEEEEGGGMSSEDYGSLSLHGAGSSKASAWNSKGFKKLSFRRRKARDHALDDDDLEDTASSPVNSPKVGDLNGLAMGAKVKGDAKQSPKEGDEYMKYAKLGISEVAEMNFSERRSDLTELRKKGLCLVPASMLIDYLK